MKITNTITIITGGSTGFGCALASELCNRGGRVVIADILVESGLKLALELNLRHPLSAVFGECDVTKKADIFGMFKLAVDTWGEYVDILVNNAGIVESMPFFQDESGVNFLFRFLGKGIGCRYSSCDSRHPPRSPAFQIAQETWYHHQYCF